MKKKALIIATTLLVVIALTVGVTFAVWNINAQSRDFNVSIGNNINLQVTFNGYNSSVDGENTYAGGEEGKLPCDDMILIPTGAVLETNVNNAYNVLFGTFKITENGGWDADTLKAVYTLKSIKFNDLDLTDVANALYNVFDVKVLAATDVNVDSDYVSKSTPATPANALVDGTTALTLGNVYYVFVSFKDSFNGDASNFMGKSLKINLEINATVVGA